MYSLILIFCLAITVLFLGLDKSGKKALLPVSAAGLLLAFGLVIWSWTKEPRQYYGEMMHDDHFSLAFSGLMIISTLLILLLSKGYFEQFSEHVAEYYTLILFSLTGGIIMASYSNLSMLFIGIEILSVNAYILAGISKKDSRSNEASIKYFLMGAFFTAFLLLGIAFIYGATGSFSIVKIFMVINAGHANILFLNTGILLVLVALCFKVSVAPFHFWTPDVYDGSPTLITIYMSTVIKVAGFAAFFLLFNTAFGSMNIFWASSIWALSVLSLFIGNIAALVQKSFKRLLAYSSISHAGYMLIAILVAGRMSAVSITLPQNAILIYSLAYCLATISAFAVLLAVSKETGSDNLDSFNGLALKNPLLALVLTISMCSLAGIPLTAGFFGKFYMFSAAIEHHQVWIVLIGVLNAIIGIYYYFKVIIAMYFSEPVAETAKVQVNIPFTLVLGVSALLTILLGVCPSLFANFLN